jgi:hypothetical protein
VEHEATHDPNHMRDFLDVYMSERKRVTEEGNTKSSFYGDAGHWNYLNTMFDFFLVRYESDKLGMCTLMGNIHLPSLLVKVLIKN